MCFLQKQILGGMPPNFSSATTVDTAEDLAYDFSELFCFEKEKKKIKIYIHFVILCSYGN